MVSISIQISFHKVRERQIELIKIEFGRPIPFNNDNSTNRTDDNLTGPTKQIFQKYWRPCCCGYKRSFNLDATTVCQKQKCSLLLTLILLSPPSTPTKFVEPLYIVHKRIFKRKTEIRKIHSISLKAHLLPPSFFIRTIYRNTQHTQLNLLFCLAVEFMSQSSYQNTPKRLSSYFVLSIYRRFFEKLRIMFTTKVCTNFFL